MVVLTATGWEKEMNYKYIEQGDRVIDDGIVRTVSEVRPHDENHATIYMTDGGCMGNDEIDHVYLESEVVA